MNDYVDQSALGLNLCIYDGIPDLSNGSVRLFKEKRAEVSHGVNIHLGIIGASHVLSLSIGESFRMMELLACTEPPGFDGYALKVPIGMIARENEGHPLSLPFSEVAYEFRGYIYKASTEEIARLALIRERIRRIEEANVGNSIALAFDFSDLGSGDTSHAFPPETMVDFSWHELARMASLSTVHTYPNEGKVVYTASKIRVRKR